MPQTQSAIYQYLSVFKHHVQSNVWQEFPLEIIKKFPEIDVENNLTINFMSCENQWEADRHVIQILYTMYLSLILAVSSNLVCKNEVWNYTSARHII